MSHDDSSGTNTEHKFFVKTLELLRKRNHDLLMNTHLAKNIQVSGLFKATLHKHMNTAQTLFDPPLAPISVCPKNMITKLRSIIKLRFSYLAIHTMLQAILKCYGCKVKHSKHSSNQVTCANLICHIKYIHYNTSIKHMIIDFFNMALCISFGSHDTSGINNSCVMKAWFVWYFVRYTFPIHKRC